MRFTKNILNIALIALLMLGIGCKSEEPTYDGPNYIMFSEPSYSFGVVDNEEWFEVQISSTHSTDSDRYFGVEVIATESSAIEGYHYVLEKNTLCIKAGKLSTVLRIRGIAENIDHNDQLNITLSLVLDDEYVSLESDTTTTVTLQRCSEFDINNFTGYAVVTSTWCMQYMNVDSRLVKSHVDGDSENVIVVEDMFYDDYDIRIQLHNEELPNPLAQLYGEQVVGSTGEAFGTIYGNGDLMMAQTQTPDYVSYYSSFERFAALYTDIYVDEVGAVGTYIIIIEWVSDDEAERIMREGF